jgi:hypothetical protein
LQRGGDLPCLLRLHANNGRDQKQASDKMAAKGLP